MLNIVSGTKAKIHDQLQIKQLQNVSLQPQWKCNRKKIMYYVVSLLN